MADFCFFAMVDLTTNYSLRKQEIVGWHFTAKNNLGSIMEQGLRPYQIDNQPKLLEIFPGGVQGIWVWNRRQLPKEEVGNVIDQAAKKNVDEVVKLKVLYSPEDCLKYRDGQGVVRDVQIFHDGSIGAWVYHYRVPATIVVRTIEPSKIKLEKVFDLRSFGHAR